LVCTAEALPLTAGNALERSLNTSRRNFYPLEFLSSWVNVYCGGRSWRRADDWDPRYLYRKLFDGDSEVDGGVSGHGVARNR